MIDGDLAIAVGDEAVYGIGLADGTVAWRVPRTVGEPSVPAIGAGPDGPVLVYLEGPGSTSGAEPTAPPTPATTTADASPTPDAETTDVSSMVAFSLGDRSEIWRSPLEAPSRGGITIEGDTAFAGDRDGNLYAVSLRDGSRRWSAAVDGAINAPVAVADGRVFAVVRRPEDLGVTVAAFDAATGEAAWPQAAQGTTVAGSIPAVAGGAVIVGSIDRSVRSLDAVDGSSSWATLARSVFFPSTSPAVNEDAAFAADFSGGLYRLDPSSGDRVWSFQFNELVIRSSPVVSGPTVLVGLDDGRLVAVDVDSGHLVWEGAPSAGALGSIALADDVAVVVKGGSDAGLIAFEHDPDGTLVDVVSPTELELGTLAWRYGAAAAIVLAVAVVPAVLVGRRMGRREPEGEGEDTLGPEDEDAPEPDDEEPGGDGS